MEIVIGIVFVIVVVLGLVFYFRKKTEMKSKGKRCMGCEGCPFYSQCGLVENKEENVKEKSDGKV